MNEDQMTQIETDDWWVPPSPEAAEAIKPKSFMWEPGEKARPRKLQRPSTRDLRAEDLTTDDFYQALEWDEIVTIVGYETKHLWKEKDATAEDKALRHDKVVIGIQPAAGTNSKNLGNKLQMFMDFYWLTAMMTDNQLKQLGENKKPLLGKRKQTSMNVGTLEDILKATGHEAVLANGRLSEQGLRPVPWADLPNRHMKVTLRNELNLDGTDYNTRVVRVSKIAKK